MRWGPRGTRINVKCRVCGVSRVDTVGMYELRVRFCEGMSVGMEIYLYVVGLVFYEWNGIVFARCRQWAVA